MDITYKKIININFTEKEQEALETLAKTFDELAIQLNNHDIKIAIKDDVICDDDAERLSKAFILLAEGDYSIIDIY